ncbi:MAG TPA: acetaldehyde dehydrogenase (acetylating) [Candidatus Copromorpha excrementigallinarum]|uniref:Acetaldehyde dehydrogenase (Acetylating) n=1 Tax=Candidatus Allocopromorpha excrementigallinarum TaxID=2840742 RepID=A0A9D1I0R0_9FIRM|nr:acetaldehyde dehydrogenase (acetylating) [Candidatus Copromorpha excrementigallinarum]
MELDRDLKSIQEARNLMENAVCAQRKFREYSQREIDCIVKAVAEACEEGAELLGAMAAEETGFGVPEDKTIKNILGSRTTYEYIRDMKTIGIINEDKEAGIMEVGVPVGVVVALIPSTNPTSTTMYKTLISLKAGNSIIISPHPSAKKCIEKTVDIINDALGETNAPNNIVQCVSNPSMEATETLMKHKDTGIILATGGEAMVKAAYSSGNPALGVGPGNGPAFIERTADIHEAVRHIVESKTFDNGTICASEQSVVVEECMEEQVKTEMERQGCYFMSDSESRQVGSFIMRGNNTMNPAIVGKSVEAICEMTGINVPSGTKILVSKQNEIGYYNPYSREKLCPILGFYVAHSWEDACGICMKLLYNEGAGHTMTIHSKDDDIIREFALKKPVSRLLVNTAASLGGVGATTSLAPAFTLGCGAVGGSATSDNVSPFNLMNVRRVAYGKKEVGDLRRDINSADNRYVKNRKEDEELKISAEEISKITKEVLDSILKGNIR